MTFSKKILLSLLGFAVMTTGLWAKAADTNQVVRDHRAKSASYEQKAKEQQIIIDEHQHMKLMQTNDPITPQPIIRKQNAHCDAILRDATKLRDDFLDFAKWHRMRAAELEGK